MIAWTRVHAISAALTESNACRASTSPAKGKTVWEHSPTRRKEWEITRINREAQLSFNCVTAPPLLPGSHYARGPPHANPSHATWRPSRASAWTRPRGLLPRVSATCASRRLAVALPRRIHAWSRVPRQLAAWARSPRHHLR